MTLKQDSSIAQTIHKAKAEYGGALIGYLPLGFPTLEKSVDAALALYDNGFDIVELGIPYSDPVMDGPVIQDATKISLEQGFKLSDVFTAVRAIRAKTNKPILLMGYWNPILQYGVEQFCKDLADAGGNGVITADLIPDEGESWIAAAKQYGIDRVFLAARYSSENRLKMIHRDGSGFIYAVSTMGVTGTRESVDDAAEELVARIRKAGNNPVCIGIGISNASQVREVLEYADGAIIGTALVNKLKTEGVSGLEQLANELSEYKRK